MNKFKIGNKVKILNPPSWLNYIGIIVDDGGPNLDYDFGVKFNNIDDILCFNSSELELLLIDCPEYLKNNETTTNS